MNMTEKNVRVVLNSRPGKWYSVDQGRWTVSIRIIKLH